MCPSDLAPDHTDLGAPNLPLSTVDESHLLAKVEPVRSLSHHVPISRLIARSDSPSGIGVIHTLDLDQAGVRVGVALSTLVTQVAAPVETLQVNSFVSMPNLSLYISFSA